MRFPVTQSPNNSIIRLRFFKNIFCYKSIVCCNALHRVLYRLGIYSSNMHVLEHILIDEGIYICVQIYKCFYSCVCVSRCVDVPVYACTYMYTSVCLNQQTRRRTSFAKYSRLLRNIADFREIQPIFAKYRRLFAKCRRLLRNVGDFCEM